MKGMCWAVAGLSMVVLFGAPAEAKLTKQERKEAAAMLKGRTLYLRTDAPCTQGRHAYGMYQSPVVDVSPKGVNLETEGGASFGWFHAGSTVWDVRINDSVELDELDFEDDTVEIELEGVGDSDGRDTTLRFVEIYSLEDFRKAFDHAFSYRPLQDEHSDWSAEIRQAIGRRQLMDGMNKRQAYYVVGTPAQVEKTEEDGKKVEIWTLRKEGLRIGYFGTRSGAPSAPSEYLRFEDGLLTSSSTAQGA
ncbi:MAG: hypothetical protein KDD47_24875, partial [Acidobacteria bacterium]|nr:hypothetical protein [Acidobacteriota bacterium]